jgi:hypothetical protein
MKAYQLAAPWVSDDEEKKIFIKRVKSLKLLSRFASNVARYFGGKRGDELQPLKSHDYHILMEYVLPLALRDLLVLHLEEPFINCVVYFNVLEVLF